MNKNDLSFADVEQLLSELAEQDLLASAREEAQTELMRGVARREIRRVFFRRRCRRAAGRVALLAGLGSSLSLLLQEEEPPTPALVTSQPVKDPCTSPAPIVQAGTSPSAKSQLPGKEALECSTPACELVIYSVPL